MDRARRRDDDDGDHQTGALHPADRILYGRGPSMAFTPGAMDSYTLLDHTSRALLAALRLDPSFFTASEALLDGDESAAARRFRCRSSQANFRSI